MCNAYGTVRRRNGYTLLELLIVLAILVVVLSLAWPSLRKLSQTGQLRDAARQLRLQLLEARLDAIESGDVRFFRYQPGTGFYEESSGSEFEIVDDLGLIAPSGAASDDRPTTWEQDDGTSSPSELPDDIIFFDLEAETTTDLAEDLGSPDIGQEWSTPIVFYPNGRTLNGRFRLASRSYAVDLSLRGLTGTVTIGEVQRLEDL
jgi:prepilin-type N-terminal cleavage/methylation domain-containing protein